MTELDKILERVLYSSVAVGLNPKDNYALQESKTALLDLALSCLIEKHVCDNGCKYHSKSWTDEHNTGVESWNAAIDTIEAQIRRAFS